MIPDQSGINCIDKPKGNSKIKITNIFFFKTIPKLSIDFDHQIQASQNLKDNLLISLFNP